MEDLTFSHFNRESCRMHKEEDGLYHRLARRFGLSDSAFWILYALEDATQSLTQTELCGYLSLSKQTINSGLKQLQQDGYIQFDGGRGRRKYLQLTESGKELVRHTVRLVIAAEERAFLGMTREERGQLLALEHKYLSQLFQESEQIFKLFQEE